MPQKKSHKSQAKSQKNKAGRKSQMEEQKLSALSEEAEVIEDAEVLKQVDGDEEAEIIEVKAEPVEVPQKFEESFDSETAQDAHADSGAQEEESIEHVQFPYSDMVRVYAPKAMDVVDKVATDWKKEGNFMNLGIENPYANMAVSLGLQQAKQIEKKLEEKGVMSAVRMGIEVVKQQVNKRK